ncbi:hypothetical protein BKA66DRAFT_451768 [Pyrenochaeta sp. MPI-SDFR-AT-0127]|nr:hypothetical protein BKA66DRAFT_451768 [Pyrenochaeta sp. MPI-SDFR-AT-0127]
MVHEILAHISAPATPQNDELYRSLADAYLQFESDKTFEDKPRRKDDDLDRPTGSEPSIFAKGNEGKSAYASADTSIVSNSKDSYGSFPSHISFEDPAKVQEDIITQPSSRLARLEHNYTEWKRQNTPRSSVSGAQRRNEQPLDGLEDADTAFIENTQLAAQALQSQLEDNFSTTFEDTSEDELHTAMRPGQKCPSAVEHARHHDRRPTTEDLASASSTPQAKFSDSNDDHAGKVPLEDALGLSVSTGNDARAVQSWSNDPIITIEPMDFTKLPTVVFPPAPKISVTCPDVLPSQVTRCLATVKLENPTRFKVSKRVYSPKFDDRGHWTVNCSKWPAKLQQEFWSALHNHIVSGRLGWGTTLHQESTSSRRLGQVKLYCWGEVVEHMWLVLWLCSKGRVSGSRSNWVDADGEAILEVP